MKKLLLMFIAEAAVLFFPGYGNQKQTTGPQALTSEQLNNLQNNCGNEAAAYFNSSLELIYSNATYVYHYNKKMDKCFMEVTSMQQSSGGIIFLLDVQAKRMYGSMNAYFDVSGKLKTTSCQINKQACSSSDAFNSAVSPYMNN